MEKLSRRGKKERKSLCIIEISHIIRTRRSFISNTCEILSMVGYLQNPRHAD